MEVIVLKLENYGEIMLLKLESYSSSYTEIGQIRELECLNWIWNLLCFTFLTLKAPVTTAAYDIHKYFFASRGFT